MAELLLELFSEEIPARMQTRAAEDLARLLGDGLKGAGFSFDTVRSFATPRRLAVVVDGLPARSPDVSEEKKGPRVGAPDAAVQGFLKSAGLKSLEQAETRADKKGDFYVALIERPGRATPEVVAEIVPEIVRNFPWQKSMRWGSGRLRWVRPLHSILCIFGGKVVPFEIDGIKSGKETRGHRFMAPKPFAVKSFDDYAKRLREAHVILDPREREAIILKGAQKLAAKQELALIEDMALLAENAGLTEWPVALMGSFDESFLDVPGEVLATSMKAHQKCFSLRRGEHLANRFIMVANLEAEDSGKAIVAGNERVIAARLSDAKFFFDHDRKVMLEDRVPKLKEIVYHEKLGTQYERVQRVRVLAREIAKLVRADPDLAERAAILAKADLTSDMVGEFPELQGVMGRYYALDQEEDEAVANAIGAHYKPVGPSDDVPREPIAISVALADKVDMLVGFWAIDEKPTGSKDPYALRRAALGVIRMVLENDLRLGLRDILNWSLNDRLARGSGYLIWRRITELPGRLIDAEMSKLEDEFPFEAAFLNHDGLLSSYVGVLIAAMEDVKQPGSEFNLSKLIASSELRSNVEICWEDDNAYGWKVSSAQEALNNANMLVERILTLADFALAKSEYRDFSARPTKRAPGTVENVEIKRFTNSIAINLLSFFADRLKVHLREEGARHDLVDAVFALGGDDLLMNARRIEVLGPFLDTEDGEHLLTGTKRAINILRIEEKKDSCSYDQPPDASLFKQPEEVALAKTVDEVESAAAAAVAREDFEAAMAVMAKLRLAVDAFFDHVTVNTDDPALRENRLRLLNRIRSTTLTVADFSKIEG